MAKHAFNLKCIAVEAAITSSSESAVLKNNIATTVFFIKTAGQSSITTRVEEPGSKDACFFSSWVYSAKKNDILPEKSPAFICFERQQQKIIFPHHHFW
ncbi:MAG TPA: hypothetical protein PKC39_14745 [Ferruginibacter sp.]|nr:hypothetical protein [Ferruginibacter sp.]HMP22215.1 hypothetical protein [Ferruginibacter sp.]